MTSTSIYTSEKVLPYVYRLDNPLTGEFYIGYRMANKLPSHIDLPKYKTSAPKVTNTFEVFEWKILAEFYDGDDAYDFEQLCIFEEWNNSLLLNKSCFHNTKGRFRFSNNSSFTHSDEAKLKISLSKLGKPRSDETKLKLHIANLGKKQSVESIIKRSLSNTGKKRTEEHKAKLSKPRSDETKLKMSISSKGKPKSEDHKIKLSNAKKGKKRNKFSTQHIENLSAKFFSIIETKKTYNKSGLSRYFPEFKQFY